MNGGDRDTVIESLALTIAKLNSEISELKYENKLLKEKNKNNGLTKQDVAQIVKETINKTTNNVPKPIAKRFNKKRKAITLNRIQNLAAQKSLSLSDIKDIIVEQEQLCSKATFYRYVDELKRKEKIESMNINDLEVVVSL